MSRYPRHRNASRISQFTQLSQRVARVWRARAARGAHYASTVDAWVRRFHHRWETDAAYRQRASIIAGSAAVIGMCAFLAVVSAVANAAILASSAGGPGGSGGSGVTNAFGAPVFPTETVPPWTPGTVPNGGVVPASGTPFPQPVATTTPSPTATVLASPVPTATTGKLPTTCDGAQAGATWALTPCPQLAGQAGTLTIAATGHGGAALTIHLDFGTCAGGGACNVDYPPGQYSLDANGNAKVQYTVPAGAAHSTTPITGTVTIANDTTLAINAAPVQ